MAVPERSHSRGRGVQKATTAVVTVSERVREALKDYRMLNSREAKAAFADHWIGWWSHDFDDAWPMVYELLRLVEEDELYKDPRRVGPGAPGARESHGDVDTYPDFAAYFVDRVRRPFETWARLESEHRYLEAYAPDVLAGTFGAQPAQDAGGATQECDVQLGATYEEYAHAAELIWGEPGRYAYTEFRRLNREHFDDTIPPIPLAFGLTAYGRCLGLTRDATDFRAHPRITLSTTMINKGGALAVTDVVLHEMVHVHLILRGEISGPSHGDAWCRAITELSPIILGHEINAGYVKPRRIPNPAHDTDPAAPKTIVKRVPQPGALSQPAISGWPGSLRPADYYGAGPRLHVDSY